MRNIPYIVGLCGGIGSGKSEVSVILSRLGAYIIDADIVSRDISAVGGSGYDALCKEFPSFFDSSGNLLRKELREFVFSNNLTGKLNDLMFPLIISEIETRILSLESALVFVVAPLLIESGLYKICNSVISIISDRDTRIDRITKRDNISKSLAIAMIDAQISDDERKKFSDIIIYNDGNIDALRRKVGYYYEKIKNNLEVDN